LIAVIVVVEVAVEVVDMDMIVVVVAVAEMDSFDHMTLVLNLADLGIVDLVVVSFVDFQMEVAASLVKDHLA
jgi:hypothetical protein